MTTDTQITMIQIAQPGWFVIRATVGDEGATGNYLRDPLVCWALLSSGDVVGLTIVPSDPASVPVLSLDLLLDPPDFVGYDYPGCLVDWQATTQAFHHSNWDPTNEDWRAGSTLFTL